VGSQRVGQDGQQVAAERSSDGAILGIFLVAEAPTNLAFDGANTWCTNIGSSSITKLRASDGVVLGTFPVAEGPSGILSTARTSG
jgi:hypothetical protein